jgi:hypothetical protein
MAKSDMLIKLHPIWKHNPARTVAECQDHNRLEHSRLAASVRDINRHVCKYILNFTVAVDHADFATPDEWAGVAEDCYYSLDGFRDAFAEPAYAQFREDEVRFANLDELILVAAVPCTLLGAYQSTSFKIFRVNWFQDAIADHAARKNWEIDYARAISHDPRIKQIVSGYIQNRPVDFDHNFPPSVRLADALDEYWIDSLDLLPEFLEREAELRAATGYDQIFSSDKRIQLAAKSRLIWDLGEEPEIAFERVRRSEV